MYRYLNIYFSIQTIFRITTFCLSCPALLRFGVFILGLLWGHSHSVIFGVLSPQVVGRLWGQAHSVILGVLNLVGTVRLIRGGVFFLPSLVFLSALGFCLPFGFFVCFPPLCLRLCLPWVFCLPWVLCLFLGVFFPPLVFLREGGSLLLVWVLEGHFLVVVVFFFCFSLVVLAYAFGFSF